MIYTNAFISCRSTKLQSFQFRLLHRTIACNHWLFNIRIKDNPNCDTCQVDDTLSHFFIGCRKVEPFWRSFKQWWQRFCSKPHNFTNTNILLGVNNTTQADKCFNYLLIQAKKFINDSKLNESKYISLYTFLHLIKNDLTIERLICVNNDNLKLFEDVFGIVFNNL